MTVYYHYTCSEKADLIGATGILIPTQLFGGPALVWLTNLADPDIEGLGLTAHSLDCDRSEVRYRARRDDFVPWLGSTVHASMPPHLQAEFHRGRTPANWFYSESPVAVIRDDR